MGKHTAECFQNTIEKIRELKLPHNRIPYAPRHTESRHLMFDKKILKEKLHPALRKYFHGYVSFIPFFVSSEYYKSVSGQDDMQWKVPTNPSIGCWCGSFYSINPEGDVAPARCLAIISQAEM